MKSPSIPYYCPRGLSPRDRLAYWSIPEALTGCTICWSAPVKDGFKMLRIGDVAVLAHRLAWELEYGPVPEGLLVLHRCSNPACVNVDHLFLGAEEEKAGVMLANGRHRAVRGEDHGAAKLTTGEAKLIFGSSRSYDDLADSFGVSDTLIYKIKHKECWKHLHPIGAETAPRF